MITHVCVVGLGYVGIPLIYALREAGLMHVTGVDIDDLKLTSLRLGQDPTGLIPDHVLAKEHGNIGWTREYPAEADAYFVCVPTPDNAGKPDYSYVEAAMQSIATVAREYATIVLESTVAPGTCHRLHGLLKELGRGDLSLFFSPERINPAHYAYNQMGRETKALACDFQTPAFDEVAKIYSKIFREVSLFYDTRVCELAKCFENAQRDTNIALMNELSMHCQAAMINYDEVVRALRTKGSSPVFHSGIVGGHCIPVDPYYLDEWYRATRSSGRPTLIGFARDLNEQYAKFIATLALLNHHSTKRVLLLGETYKPDVADKRNAAAGKLAKELRHLVDVAIYDPLTGTTAGEFHEPFGCVIGLVNHDQMWNETYAQKFMIHEAATFINAGGFSARQMTGFLNIINV